MQSIRSSGALAILAVLLAACGGNAGATQQPAGATAGTGGGTATENPQATDEPAATEAGGGGGTSSGHKPAGWDRFGKVHVEMGGPVSKTTDLGFIPAGSFFGGAQGTSMNFTIEGSNEILSILISADQKVVVSYGGLDFSMPGTECTTSNWNIGATSGSGSFDCTASLVILASGASLTGGTLKGNFDAHAT